MTNPNHSAFPQEYQVGVLPIDAGEVLRGLTKREYFAGQALRGAIEWRDAHSDPAKFDVKSLAQDCCVIADALITELSKNVKRQENP